MASVYTPFDATKPDASSQNITELSDSVRSNLAALIHMVLMGVVPGWSFQIDKGTITEQRPQYYIMTRDGTNERFRITNTWATGRISNILIEWSDDAGATYDTVGNMDINYTGTTTGATFLSTVWN